MKILLLAIMLILNTGSAFAKDAEESAFDRILRTGTIRCGYVVYSPSIIKDPNTGKLSGIFYDITEKLGERLNLKVEWTEEVSFPTMLEGFKTDRYDVLCLNGWGTASLSPHVTMTTPLYYSVINAFVRADDTRFDGKKEAINDPSVKISTIDGTGTAVFAQQTFPKAQQVTMPPDTDYSLTILNVINKKADVVLIENSLAAAFQQKNPGTIRQVNLGKPLRYYANSYYVSIDEQKLQSMLNMTLGEMLGAGEIDDIVSKYDTKNPPSYLPFAAPYGE